MTTTLEKGATPATTGRQLTYVKAFNEALRQVMREDEDVFVVGEDVAGYGGVFHMFDGLLDEFGPRRVIDTPISEAAIVGLGVGAAARGLRPVVDIMFMDFLGVCLDQVVNQAAKMKFMFGGEVRVPLIITTASGAGLGAAAQHSQSLEAWLAHTPGLKVAMPSSAYDAKGLMVAAVRDDNPVVVMLNKKLLGAKGDVPEELYEIPLGQAATIARRAPTSRSSPSGRMVARGAGRGRRSSPARASSVEVIDPRTVQPLDTDTIVASVRRTNRVAGGARGRHLRRDRRGDRRPDPGGGVRLPRRAGPAHRRALLPGAVQPGARERPTCPTAPRSPRGAAASSSGAEPWRLEVLLPKLGLTMEEGTIVEWLARSGDRRRRPATSCSGWPPTRSTWTSRPRATAGSTRSCPRARRSRPARSSAGC